MSQDQPIRVLLVDDHAMLRRGLRFFLKGFDDLELVGEASSGQEAVAICGQIEPDVVLMDMVMPEMDGAKATRLIREKYPCVQVIALTSFQEEALIEKALQAGAIGYLLKNVSAEELASAIRGAFAGRPTLAPEATEALIQTTRQRAQKMDYGLSEREKEVLALLTEGLSNAEIAERLVISLSTAKFHVGGILRKLGVSNRAEAVARAMKDHMLD